MIVPEPAGPPPLVDTVPAALRRLHKIDSEVEPYKLHLKHYHMTLKHFKARASELALPKCIYDKYEKIISQL